MNTLILVGNITKDAETRQAGDSTVTGFGLAENKKIKGEAVTVFYDCAIWGDRGTKIAQYLTKGGQVTVIGELMPPRLKDGKVYLDVRVNDVSLPVKKATSDDAW